MKRSFGYSLGALVLAALGCDGGKEGAATTGQAAVTATATAAASGTATATAAAASAPGSFGGFHLVAEGGSMAIYPMGDAAIVDTGAFYAVLGDGPLEQDPQLFRASIENEGRVNVTEAARYERFFGAWPHQAWAMGDAGAMRRVNDLYTKQDPLREGERILDLAAWENKRAIAAIRMAEPDIRFALAGSNPGGVVPAPGKPTAEQEGCAVRMDPGAPLKLAGLPSGHLFAIGRECKTDKPVAERWQPRQVRGEAAVIEGVTGAPVAIAAVAGDEAYALFDDGSLATWDGKAWKGEKSPVGAGRSAFASSDGTAWILGADGLAKHPKGGAWAKVDLGGARPTSAWAKDDRTVWVVADGTKLLRSGPAAGAPLKLPAPGEVQEIVSRDRRWPATPACKRTLVHLATLAGSGDKAPTSFPALTEAVKGNAELTSKDIQYLVEESGGSLFAVAKVPSAAIADKLVAAFKAKNASAKPMVYCHEPAVIKGALKVE